MLNGRCHCGEVGWALDAFPASITACNCSVCRRYGALWAYGTVGVDVQTSGETGVYRRSDGGDLDFHFCSKCGCMMYWAAVAPDGDGRMRIAVNVRMSDLSPIRRIPIRHFEGHESYSELPRDGRTVADMWF